MNRWRDHFHQARAAAMVSLLAAAAAAVAGAGVAGTTGAFRILAWTLAGGAATAVLAAASARLFAPANASGAGCGPGIGVANGLTLIRFVLIAPTVVLFATSRYAEAAAFYVVLILTDVADGIVARARRETSRFGVVMDPLADVASTFAVFTVFAGGGWIPAWLYGLLVARYAMLLVGSLALMIATGPVEFRATLPGKVVGVVQAIGAVWIMAVASGNSPAPGKDGLLFAFLGLGFVSIVVSQAVIGWRHMRRAAARTRGWQRGSSR